VSQGDESTRIAMWIKSQCNSSAIITGVVGAGNIWELPIPQNKTLPAVGFNQLSSVDVATQEQFRIMVNELWIVRLVTEGQTHTGAVLSVVDEFDRLFHATDGVIDGTTSIYSSTREQTFRLSEDRDGKQYRHTGATYRIFAQRN
jgi:hypothetical protein